MMREIKLRLDATEDAFQRANRDVSNPKAILECEFCYLQLRRCCEVVALATLLAHNGIEEFRSARLLEKWHGAELLTLLAKLSDDAFPEPTVVSNLDHEGVADLHIEAKASENRKELNEIYGKCGDKLHAGSLKSLLSAGGKHYDLGEIRKWRGFFIQLLNSHAILLPDRKAVMVVFMSHADEGEDVRCQFLPIKAVEGEGAKRSLRPRREP